MINDQTKATGELEIVLKDQYGNIKVQKTVPNLVVTTGKNFMAASMIKTDNVTTVAMTHMGVGSSVTAPTTADTALGTPLDARRTLTASALNNVVTYSCTFAAGQSTGAITEAGIFNASTAGTMLSRTTFSVVNKDALDTLTINWNITLS